MPSKRERAIKLLHSSKDRLEILHDHLENSITLRTREDFRYAQSHTSSYDMYMQFSFLVRELDLATEGVRQIREMGQTDVLEALGSHVTGDVNDFIALHTHLFHTYGGIDPDILYDTLKKDVPMMISALRQTLAELELGNEIGNSPDSSDGVLTVDLRDYFKSS